MTQAFDILSSFDRRAENYSLDREFYSDKAVYATDLEKIWYQSWIFAAHSVELAKHGDTVGLPVGDYRVTLTNQQGHYVAHAERAGKKSKVHAREAEGYVFISLAKTPDAFDAFAATVEPYLKPHDVKNLKVVAETSIIEYGNWKLVFENNRECYHCLSNHPELIITFPEDPAVTGNDASSEVPAFLQQHWDSCDSVNLPSEFILSDDGSYRVTRVPLLEDFRSYTMDGYDAVKRRIGEFDGSMKDINPGALLLFHYPSSWNHFLNDQVTSFRVLPLGPQASLVTTKWLINADAEEGMDYDLHNLTHVWTQTNLQDKYLVEENQRGVNSPEYASGPYSSAHESGVIQFVEWYQNTLSKRLNA